MNKQILTEENKKYLDAFGIYQDAIEDIENIDEKELTKDHLKYVEVCVKELPEYNIIKEFEKYREQKATERNAKARLEYYTDYFEKGIYDDVALIPRELSIRDIFASVCTALYMKRDNQLRLICDYQSGDKFVVKSLVNNKKITHKFDYDDVNLMKEYYRIQNINGLKLFYRNYILQYLLTVDELLHLPDVENPLRDIAYNNEDMGITDLLRNYENNAQLKMGFDS